MGRHADPDARHFWRSLGAAVGRATAALALVASLFAALSLIGSVPEDGPAVREPDAHDHSHHDPDWSGPEPDDAAEPAPDPPQEPTAQDEPSPGAQPDPLEALLAAAPAPEETTVQVLDGVGGSPRLPLLAAAIEDLGYRVVATNPASTDYAVTTVLYGEGMEPAAIALQARDGRIAERRPNPGLSAEIDLHVVLGADWEP